MGNCFSWCTKNKGSASSLGREKNAKAKRKVKRKGSICIDKNSSSLTPKDKLSVTSVESSDEVRTAHADTKSECATEGSQTIVDLTVIGRAIPIRQKPPSPEMEPAASNARIIVVQPSATSENCSDETIHEEVKRPITGSESNASLSLSSVVEQPAGNEELEELGHEEESSATLPQPRASVDQEVPVRSSHFQLLEFLKIRLDMAANNLEMNRLLANVDRALDRASRTRLLGFQRMRAAAEARRAAQEIQEEAGTEEEETETEDGEEGDEEDDDEGDTPPPPIPRICWQ